MGLATPARASPAFALVGATTKKFRKVCLIGVDEAAIGTLYEGLASTYLKVQLQFPRHARSHGDVARCEVERKAIV